MNLLLGFLIGICTLTTSVSVAAQSVGTVHLHNGGRIHGELMEVLPGDQVRLRLVDGSVRTIPWSDVARVDDPSVVPVGASGPAKVAASPAQRNATSSPRSYESDEPRFEAVSRTIQRDVASSTPVTLALFGSLGLAGGISATAELTVGTGTVSQVITDNGESDFDPSFGGGAHVDVPLHTHFSVGGFTRVLSWKTSSAEDRGLFIEFAVTPRARFPFPVGSRWGAFFIEAAVGTGVVDLPGSDSEGIFRGSRVERSNSPLFLAGGGTGLQLLLSDAVGVTFELAWHHHFFNQSVRAELQDGLGVSQTVEGDASFNGGQLMLQFGLLVSL